MVKKIILVNGSNILGEMLLRGIDRESGLELEHRFHSLEDLKQQVEQYGINADDHVLILGSNQEADEAARYLLARAPGVKTFNLAVDGSKVTLRWMQKEVIRKVTLPELVEILRED